VGGPLNSSKPTTSVLTSGVYNTAYPTPADGQACAIQLDANGNLKVAANVAQVVSTISVANSTAVALAGNETFFGTSIDLVGTGYTAIQVQALADQAGTLQIQFSTDNSHWDHTISGAVTANESASVSTGIHGRYVRVVFVNGAVAQSFLRLQTLLVPIPTQPTIKDLDTPASGDDNSLVVRAILTGASAINPGVYTAVNTDTIGNLTVGFSGQSADAFGRARIAAPVSEFDTQFQYDTQPLLFSRSVVGGGAITKTTNESSLTLSTGDGTNASSAINQTKQYFRYEPGKSQQIMMTGVLGAKKTNVRSRIGYFDVNDGVFFEMNGSDGAAVVQRTSISGSPSDATRVLQANWNADKMDGTGPSGVVLDFSTTQVFVIDLQWLGVGRVRFGFFVQGALVICHQIYNANTIASPYMNTANLPCRAEITNTGAAGTATIMKQICMTVVSEGGVDVPQAYEFSVSNGITLVTGITSRAPLLSIRPKTTFNSITNRSLIEVIDFDIFNNASSIGGFWELVYNGTLSGGAGAWVSADTNSGIEYNIDRTACANGTVVASGYVGSGKTTASISPDIRLPFTLDYAGTTADILTLCVSSQSTAIGAAAAIRWREIR